MSLWQWLKRAGRRAEQSTDDTALGLSVTGTSGAGGVNAAGVSAALGEIEKAEREETEGGEPT